MQWQFLHLSASAFSSFISDLGNRGLASAARPSNASNLVFPMFWACDGKFQQKFFSSGIEIPLQSQKKPFGVFI